MIERLRAALAEDGVDLDRATPQSLAPCDQFHGRGLEATVEIGSLVDVAATDHLLNVGSGIGGPARWFAQRFGCRVTGIDLTSALCEAAIALTRLLRLHGRVHSCSALAFVARSRAMVERGEKPPQRAVNLIHEELAPQAIANVSRALAETRIDPIEVLAKKRP